MMLTKQYTHTELMKIAEAAAKQSAGFTTKESFTKMMKEQSGGKIPQALIESLWIGCEKRCVDAAHTALRMAGCEAVADVKYSQHLDRCYEQSKKEQAAYRAAGGR